MPSTSSALPGRRQQRRVEATGPSAVAPCSKCLGQRNHAKTTWVCWRPGGAVSCQGLSLGLSPAACVFLETAELTSERPGISADSARSSSSHADGQNVAHPATAVPNSFVPSGVRLQWQPAGQGCGMDSWSASRGPPEHLFPSPRILGTGRLWLSSHCGLSQSSGC